MCRPFRYNGVERAIDAIAARASYVRRFSRFTSPIRLSQSEKKLEPSAACDASKERKLEPSVACDASKERKLEPSAACDASKERKLEPSVACDASKERKLEPSAACDASKERKLEPSVACDASTKKERKREVGRLTRGSLQVTRPPVHLRPSKRAPPTPARLHRKKKSDSTKQRRRQDLPHHHGLQRGMVISFQPWSTERHGYFIPALAC